MTHKSLPQRLDDVANWTGIPKIAMRPTRRRAMRWLPLVPLAMALAGCVLPYVAQSYYVTGQILVSLSMAVASMFPLLGPLKPWGTSETPDERERELRRRAFLVALGSVAFLATAGLMVLPALALIARLPLASLVERSSTLGLAMLTVINAVPTLYASWAAAPLPADEDDI